MLPKQNRLKKQTDFDRVFKEGKGVREDFLLLKFAKNGLKVSRFGFVVGRKVAKKAVLRNKIKRKLREVVRKELPKIKPGFDGIWLVVREPNLREIEAVAKKIIQKTKLL